MIESLEQVLADELGDAQVLRARGHAHDAALIERLVERVKYAAEDYITWLSEKEAVMRSGHTVNWLRARFPQWLGQGHARKDRGVRYYRAVIIPQRSHPSAAAEAGRRAADAEYPERGAA